MLAFIGLVLVSWGIGVSVICGYIGKQVAARASVSPTAGQILGMTLGPAGIAILSSAIRRGTVRGTPYRVS